MDIYDRVNKKPKTLLAENKLSTIYEWTDRSSYLKEEQFVHSK